MATFKQLPSGLWQVQIFRRGVRRSATFDKKGAAVAWAGNAESEIIAGTHRSVPDKTFGDLLRRYKDDITPTKRGARWEAVRITLLLRDPIAKERLRNLSAVHVALWRDRRLKAVAAPSVRREWNILSHACNTAVKEWHWLSQNPFKEVRRPKSARHRERLFTADDLKRLDTVATTPLRQEVMRVLRFCIETGMRAGEACGLIEVTGTVGHLDKTKNGDARDVPLSAAAIELFRQGWTITPRQLDVNFRLMRKDAGLSNLHFHDTRHTACTNLSRKLNVLQLQRVLGIRDPRVLAVYYNESAEDIAKML
jgi:integrase